MAIPGLHRLGGPNDRGAELRGPERQEVQLRDHLVALLAVIDGLVISKDPHQIALSAIGDLYRAEDNRWPGAEMLVGGSPVHPTGGSVGREEGPMIVVDPGLA